MSMEVWSPPATVEEFLLEGLKECWIKRPGISVYVRAQRNCLDGVSLTPTLVLANVVVDAERRREGLFRLFLAEMEQAGRNHDRVVYVENVLHQGLCDFLAERGYARRGTNGLRDFHQAG